MNNIDLKLLAIVSELHRTRSVSKTADRLGLRQSAVSMSLARMRRHFKDPVFVRTSSGMEPTPHGADLIQLMKRAEEMLQRALCHHVVFDPSVSSRIFHICSSDIEQVALIPKLLRRLKEVAPCIRIEVGMISDEIPALLESGGVDLAVGFIPPMGAGFCRQSLFEERFVCAVRRNHPRVNGSLTLEQLQYESHLAVAVPGVIPALMQNAFDAAGIHRNIALTLPSFLEITSIVMASDYLAILPQSLMSDPAVAGRVRVLELPFPMPAYWVGQHWHERFDLDPALQWLRGLIAELFPAPKRNGAGNG